MHHQDTPPKCGSFSKVDKRHLQAGIDQERQAELRKQSFDNMINDVGVWFIQAFFISLFFYLVLFGE